MWRARMGDAVGVRRAAKKTVKFLLETVGEAVGELILTLLACALLGCLALIGYASWSFSPRLTLAGAGLISLFLAHGAGGPSAIPRRGAPVGVTATGVTATGRPARRRTPA
jgi:TRAP-type C4-dicarboxylate transport system permease small subunit